jgi:membrane protein DedA with SNARE-associated domain
VGALLADLVRWVFDVIHAFGYVGVFVLILAGSLFLPVPTELTLPASAARVSASLIMYELGLRISEARLRRLVRRLERFRLVFESDLDGASGVFEKHGGKAILVGQLIPGVGALVSVPAGMKRMPLRWRHLGYTVLGSTLWTGTLIGLGWALGGRWRIVETFTSFVGSAGLILLVCAILFFFWRRSRTHGRSGLRQAGHHGPQQDDGHDPRGHGQGKAAAAQGDDHDRDGR